MTLETYSNFIKIVECGSISAASEELLIAQPALSTQLKNLEQKIGSQLLIRDKKRVELTPAGEIFYKNAKILCSINEEMMRDIENCSSGQEGVLKLSMPPSNPPSLMHALFDEYVKTHPNVKFQIHEVLSSQVAEDVKNGISEIGMVRATIRNSDDYHFYPYSKEEMMALVPVSNPLSKCEFLTLDMILDQKISTTEGIVPLIDKAFSAKGKEPKYQIKTSIRRTAIMWSQYYEDCITVLPCIDEELKDDPRYNILRIKDYDFSIQRSFIIAKDRRLSPLAQGFLSHVLESYMES